MLGIYKVFDNEGATIDRYTVVFRGCTSFLTLSHNPDSPKGVSMWGEGKVAVCEGDKEIPFTELPKEVQEHIRRRLEG